ncbi:hypothetical protein NSTCB13_00841 [Nostoc sp. DSM 114160]|jgi:hypothetical protein
MEIYLVLIVAALSIKLIVNASASKNTKFFIRVLLDVISTIIFPKKQVFLFLLSIFIIFKILFDLLSTNLFFKYLLLGLADLLCKSKRMSEKY